MPRDESREGIHNLVFGLIRKLRHLRRKGEDLDPGVDQTDNEKASEPVAAVRLVQRVNRKRERVASSFDVTGQLYQVFLDSRTG